VVKREKILRYGTPIVIKPLPPQRERCEARALGVKDGMRGRGISRWGAGYNRPLRRVAVACLCPDARRWPSPSLWFSPAGGERTSTASGEARLNGRGFG